LIFVFDLLLSIQTKRGLALMVPEALGWKKAGVQF